MFLENFATSKAIAFSDVERSYLKGKTCPLTNFLGDPFAPGMYMKSPEFKWVKMIPKEGRWMVVVELEKYQVMDNKFKFSVQIYVGNDQGETMMSDEHHTELCDETNCKAQLINASHWAEATARDFYDQVE